MQHVLYLHGPALPYYAMPEVTAQSAQSNPLYTQVPRCHAIALPPVLTENETDAEAPTAGPNACAWGMGSKHTIKRSIKSITPHKDTDRHTHSLSSDPYTSSTP